MSKLDTNHVVNLDLVKDRVNSVIKFGLADVETSDFFVGLYNNGSRVFDKDYIVTLDQYNSTYKKGGTLEINYNPNEPTDIVQKGSKFIYIVFRIMGIGFVIIGIPLRKVMLRIS